MDIVTIYFYDAALNVLKEVAEHHGLKNGQKITDEHKFSELVRDNCRLGIWELETKSMLSKHSE